MGCKRVQPVQAIELGKALHGQQIQGRVWFTLPDQVSFGGSLWIH